MSSKNKSSGSKSGKSSGNDSFKVGRDAKTGEFITVAEAKRRPNTTVIETIKKKD